MELTRSVVETKAAEYREHEPLYPVEREQVDSLSAAFETGEYGWRDAEWVVRWYYRRYLGAIANETRRAREDAFGRNDFETVRAVIGDVAAGTDTSPSSNSSVRSRIDRLTDLDGVDVEVASAYLFFFDPASEIVLGEREWSVLRGADELDGPYPESPTAAEYETYRDQCRSIGDRHDCEMWTLYRALWRCWKDEYGDDTDGTDGVDGIDGTHR